MIDFEYKRIGDNVLLSVHAVTYLRTASFLNKYISMGNLDKILYISFYIYVRTINNLDMYIYVSAYFQ